MSKLKSNVAFQIIAGVVFVLLLLSGILSVIGYYEFTSAIEDQYAKSALYTAKTAATYLTPEFLTPEFLRGDNYSLRESQMKFQNIRREWRKLVDTQNATLVYLFKAEGKNYEDVEFSINIPNSSFDFHEFAIGYKIKQTDGRYLAAFKDIYDNHQQCVEIAVYRPKTEEFISGNHITVMLPYHGSNGEILGILAVERPMEELDSVRSAYLHKVMTATAALLLIVLIVYGLYLKRNLLTPIQRIAKETLRFAHESTKASIPLSANIATTNEIGQLAHSIDTMESDILSYIENLTKVTQEKEQIKAELNIATQIQADMLPRIFPPFPDRKEFEIYASMTPAKEVGGDFYDFFMTDENHLALVIADVSGKGVPAALFMVIAKTLIKNRAQMGGSPSEILGDVNKQLCEGNEADLFVTVWLGILELSTGKIIASNAGHEYPAIKRTGGTYELMKAKHSPAVATFEGIKFRENEFELNAGDEIYLYTDGVAEATNSDNELFGTGRMIEALNKNLSADVEELLKNMKTEVDDFTGEAPQFDDITMLCLKYNGGNHERTNSRSENRKS